MNNIDNKRFRESSLQHLQQFWTITICVTCICLHPRITKIWPICMHVPAMWCWHVGDVLTNNIHWGDNIMRYIWKGGSREPVRTTYFEPFWTMALWHGKLLITQHKTICRWLLRLIELWSRYYPEATVIYPLSLFLHLHAMHSMTDIPCLLIQHVSMIGMVEGLFGWIGWKLVINPFNTNYIQIGNYKQTMLVGDKCIFLLFDWFPGTKVIMWSQDEYLDS